MKDISLGPIIVCPHCGYQYLPAEIYLPNSFLGKPEDITREGMSGNIQYYFGTNMNLDEKYICDCCNQPFQIHAKVQFNTEGIDFSKPHKTMIKKQSLFLNED